MGVGAIVQWVGCLLCMQQTWIWSGSSHMLPQTPTGVILECRAMRKPWALLGVSPNQKQTESYYNYLWQPPKQEIHGIGSSTHKPKKTVISAHISQPDGNLSQNTRLFTDRWRRYPRYSSHTVWALPAICWLLNGACTNLESLGCQIRTWQSMFQLKHQTPFSLLNIWGCH